MYLVSGDLRYLSDSLGKPWEGRYGFLTLGRNSKISSSSPDLSSARTSFCVRILREHTGSGALSDRDACTSIGWGAWVKIGKNSGRPPHGLYFSWPPACVPWSYFPGVDYHQSVLPGGPSEGLRRGLHRGDHVIRHLLLQGHNTEGVCLPQYSSICFPEASGTHGRCLTTDVAIIVPPVVASGGGFGGICYYCTCAPSRHLFEISLSPDLCCRA